MFRSRHRVRFRCCGCPTCRRWTTTARSAAQLRTLLERKSPRCCWIYFVRLRVALNQMKPLCQCSSSGHNRLEKWWKNVAEIQNLHSFHTHPLFDYFCLILLSVVSDSVPPKITKLSDAIPDHHWCIPFSVSGKRHDHVTSCNYSFHG